MALTPSASAVSKYLDSLSCSAGGKHAYFRAISVFYNWLYSTRSGLSLGSIVNPITLVDAPKRPKRILPSLRREQVEALIANAGNVRDKVIIALFTESGLRLSELLGIKTTDIHWEAHNVRVTGKGK